jgi:hypothetical protein
MRKPIYSIFFSVIFLLSLQSIFAQSSNCEDLKKENEYLKKALGILSPIKTVTVNKVDFIISKCEGNIKEQTIELSLILTNHAANNEISFRKAIAVDIEANEYETYKINVGSSSSSNKIYTDVPVKTIIKFEKVLPSVKLLKIISIEFLGNNGGFEYKDIPVTWK